jgi:hypothetical protein
MPRAKPPRGRRPEPHFKLLPAGSLLWCVTSAGDLDRPPFSRAPEGDDAGHDRLWGGRFDPPHDDGGYRYAAMDEMSAVSEVLLRDLHWSAERRYVPLATVTGRRLTLLETRRPFWLVDLTTIEALAAVRQDTWLVQADAGDYALTQLWSGWLRTSVPPGTPDRGPDRGPAGFVWPSRRNPGGRSVILFESECAGDVRRLDFADRALDDAAGLAWLNLRLDVLQTKIDLSTAGPLPGVPGAGESFGYDDPRGAWRGSR